MVSLAIRHFNQKSKETQYGILYPKNTDENPVVRDENQAGSKDRGLKGNSFHHNPQNFFWNFL